MPRPPVRAAAESPRYPTLTPPTLPAVHTHPTLRSCRWWLGSVLAAGLAAASAAAQGPARKTNQPPVTAPEPTPTARTAPGTAAPLTREDVEAFIDGIAPLQLAKGDIAGMVVCVVKDGKVLFEKGYGYADVKRKKPVSADSTLFRIGSTSKTFTWTAVMQLIEQGKIDPDRDVNAYLDFTIPPAFGKPITMRNLMTHTPGFEEVIKELFVADSASLVPLGQWLKTHRPKQIYPAGTTPAYSNYGAALAGYIVERVSGVPFDTYIEKNIFQPLQMSLATFRQPLPPALAPLMSLGYQKASDDPKPFELVAPPPAGSVSASADAMSHWMIAQLHDGAFGDVRIMKPETAQRMHSRLFGVMPALPGMAHGFYEETRNGHRVIGHGGDTQWFHSDMHLMLDDDVGFFVSYNSAGNGKGTGRTELWHRFLDRYFPYTPATAGAPVPHPLDDARSVAGTYRSSRRAQTTFLSALDMAAQSRVSVNGDTTISVSGMDDLAGNPKHFREISPLVFREVGGQDLVGFTKDYSGRTVMATELPFEVGQRAPALKTASLNRNALVFAIAMFVLTILFWPVNALLRRHYGARLELDPRYRRLRTLVRTACIVSLAFTIGLVVFFSKAQNNIGMLSSRGDGTLRVIQLLGLLGLVGAAAAVYYAVRSWRIRSLWTGAKVWNTLLAVGFICFAFFLLNWHLLSPSLRY